MGNPLDITGQKFNMLTALEKTDKRTSGGLIIWRFQCECGNIIEKPAAHVKSGNTKSCGCLKRKTFQKLNEKASEKAKILIGEKFGKLTVIEDLGLREHVKGHNRRWYKCLCDCGNYKEVMGNQLKQGQTSSCGQCNFTSKGEYKIKTLLEEEGYIFNYDFVLPELFQETGRRLRFDFVIYNKDFSIKRIIEFDGRQHITGPDKGHWSRTTDTLETIRERDSLKNNFCKKHNYILVRIPYNKLKTLTINDIMGNQYVINKESDA